MKGRSLRSLALPVIALPVLLIASCGDDTTKPEEPTEYPSATTFEQLVKNLRTAYTFMNSEEYEKLLDDSFDFVFDPRDITADNGFKERYSRGDEMASLERMFGGEPNSQNLVVKSIRIAFEIGEPVVSPENQSWMKVSLSNFELRIEATHLDTGETWILLTSGGYRVDVHGAEVQSDPPLWKIMRIVDLPPTAAGAAVHEATWGSIKSSFHPSAIAYPEATTIDQLLDNFHDALRGMNYREYDRLLDFTYEFVFDPRDVSAENGFKESWSKEEDLGSMRNLFGGRPDRKNRVAQTIRMSFAAGPAVDSDEGEGWKQITLSAFEMEVEAIKIDDGETWFLRTKGGYRVDLYIKDTGGSSSSWRIMRMVDRPPTTFRGGATEDATWGRIKTGYS